MNETWPWLGWSPRVNGGAKIYQRMRNYFNSQGRDNLVWVWNVQGTQTLVNALTGRCLDATGQGMANGTLLQIWTCNGKGNQRWTIPA
jgi:mannan endo-1,4-beta-mannosidase